MRDKSLQIVGLSKRLESIVELAGSGDTLCDVGCDHAHVPIRLLQNGQYRRAIGMDVIEGPLGKARGNLELYGMTGDVELRLSDGLNAFHAGEADTLVVTGMGGTLMREILLREPDKTRSFSALVLGPQSDPDRVRAAVRELGFSLEDERLIFEDGKYYPVLRAAVDAQNRKQVRQRREPGLPGIRSPEPALFPPEIPEELCREAEDLFGPLLLKRRDPVLREFLVRRIAVLKKIRDSVSRAAEGQKASEKEHPDKEHQEKKCPEQEIPEQQNLEQQNLEQKHLQKKREIEHSLQVYQAALKVFLQTEVIT